MGDGTSISWTDATWNPTRGCRRTAPAGSKTSGCGDASGGGCYAERQAARFCGPGQAYEGLITLTANGPRWSGKTKLVTEHLADPLRWVKPRKIFVDSMSDLFYEGFTDEEIMCVVGVMCIAMQHTYQLLTKRARRMRDFFRRYSLQDCVELLAEKHTVPGPRRHNYPPFKEWHEVDSWPAPWIWLGVSVENQAAADERIPLLLDTPARVRFISAEPLIGPVSLNHIGYAHGEELSALEEVVGHVERPALSWVIAGAESGPGARECEVGWLRSLRDQCAAARVPFFLKQAEAVDGAYTITDHRPVPQVVGRVGELIPVIGVGDGSREKGRNLVELPYLDGVQHAAFPEVRP